MTSDSIRRRGRIHGSVLKARTSLLSAVMAAGMLLLAGCGDDDDSDEAATSTTSSAVTTTTAAPSTTSTSSIAATAKCQSVPFTPNSEDLASDIEATGLSCDEAEAFVRIAGKRTSSGGPAELDVEGFHCERTRTEEDPLPRAYYECTSGTKKVTFVRT